MPSRILREGILTSEPVNSLLPEAELFYRRLMSVVDDFGRYYASPKLLRPACYPLQIDRISEQDIERWLTACEWTEPQILARYEVQGKQYLEMVNLKDGRSRTSKFPANPDSHVRADVTDSDSDSDSKTDSDSGIPFSNLIPPSLLSSAEFPPAWTEWAEHRREIRAKLTERAAKKTLAEMDEWGVDRSVAAINHSIAQGYRGCFEPKGNQRSAPSVTDELDAVRKPPSEEVLRMAREAQMGVGDE